MGECKYEMKLVYGSAEDAQKALPKVKEFVDELNALYDLWQNNRNKSHSSVEAANQVAKFLNDSHPKIFSQMGLTELEPDRGLNCYSGNIAAGATFDIEQQDEYILLSAVVWHCSDWTRHAQAMVKHYGALKAYIRDEESTRTWKLIK